MMSRRDRLTMATILIFYGVWIVLSDAAETAKLRDWFVRQFDGIEVMP